MTGAAGRFFAVAAAVLMVALIGGITLTGKWPTGEIVAPHTAKGILAIPAEQVARAEVSTGEKDMVFQHGPGGSWLVDGTPAQKAIAEHMNDAVRLLNKSTPTRTLDPAEYTAQIGEFGLDPPRMLVSLFSADGKAASIAFGEATPGQNAQYVRVIGRSRLYLLPRFVGVEWQLAVDMAQRMMPAGAAGGASRSSALLLPVSMAEIWAVEIVENGVLTRFERDPAGDWFHHTGHHVHKPGGFVHKADPKFAPLIAAELTALEGASIETVVARHPDEDTLGQFGLDHPPSIMLLYSRDSSRPVARIEFGKPTQDGFARYARVQETDSVVTVADYASSHLGKLLQLAGVRS